MHEYVSAATSRGVPIIFGENYVQELKAKRAEMGPVAEFHLIGPLQSNKIKEAVRNADVIQSVHSLSILQGIAQEASRQAKRQRVFLQVNIGNDPAKSGFSADSLTTVFDALGSLSASIEVLGLMTITPYYESAEAARSDFARMAALRDAVQQSPQSQLFANSTVLLSMGMSADFYVAIQEGADLVRVGTALFGERE
jgi:pyridoxal phosphate enzyme (YggS family)